MSRALVCSSTPDQWIAAYRLANTLLRAGLPVGWALEPFDAGGRRCGRGTFVIPLEPEAWVFEPFTGHTVADLASRAAAQAEITFGPPVQVDAPVLPLSVARIGIYGGGGAPYNYARIFAELGFVIEFVMPQDIRRGALADVDLLAVPGGGLYAMKGQLDPLGEAGCRAIDRWVRGGGMYLGSCAGAFDAAIVSQSFLAACPQQRCMELINARVWNSPDTEWIGLASPGVGVLRTRVVRPDHPVMFNLPQSFEVVHYNGPVFEAVPGAVEGASEAEGLAVVAGITKRFTPAEFFLRFSQYAGDVSGTLIDRGIAAGVCNVITGYLDRGRVVLFGSHPEFGSNLAMDRYEIPALMLANSALWQSAVRPRRTARAPLTGSGVSRSMAQGLDAARRRLEEIRRMVSDLAGRRLDPLPPWLHESVAMSTFGLSGRQIWAETLADFPRLLDEFEAALDSLQREVDAVNALVPAGPALPDNVRQDLGAAIGTVQAALHYRVPEQRHQDFGYEGLLQTLERCTRMLAAARQSWDVALTPSPNPYAHFEASPYHLAVGSYLAAAGVMANALHLTAALAAQVQSALQLANLHAAPVGPRGPS